MKEILFAVSSISLFSYVAGYGLAKIALPSKLKPYTLWLSPWVLYLFTTVSLIIFSLLGVPIKISGSIVAGLSLLASGYFLFIKKEWPKINWKVDLNIATVVALSVLLNISPLIMRDKFLTTISLGNNDIITYTTNADYLIDHSIAENFNSNVILTIANLLRDGYRWGPPVIEGYFLNLTGFEGYQISYLMEALLYAFMIPLVFVLVSLLSQKKLSWITAGFLSLLMALNVNTLYMLYHNFWGLVYFWGILMFLVIALTSYFGLKTDQDKKHEVLATIGFAALFFSYHEPAVFTILSLFLYGGYLFISKNNIIGFLQKMIRIMGGLLMIGGVSVANAIVFDFGQAFASNLNQPIGWQLFRESIPYANPFEMLGFWSIHSFKPLPILLAVFLSLIIVLVVIKGLLSIPNKNQKAFLTSFISIFVFFLVFTGLPPRGNFFDFNRAITYSLPVVIAIFGLGLRDLFKKHQWAYIFAISIFSSLLLFSAYKLNRRFIAERAAVDLQYTTLKELKDLEIGEPIYTEGAFIPDVSVWRQIWVGYFVYPHIMDATYPPAVTRDPYQLSVPNKGLVLISKSTPWIKAPQLIFTEILWENEWYKLGRICNADECLIQEKQDLSNLILGESEFEDSLLISGWYGHENDGRWSNGLESTLRLASYRQSYRYLVIEAQALSEPESLTIEINDQEINTQSLTKGWGIYKFRLPSNFKPGVQQIKLKYSHVYQPSQILGNGDNRNLAIRFRQIYFE